ncbi:hypothetical protein HGRIS_001896 [Hohenbuehelia grisea]|uniref:F-BAR domain-containing protein n=1 Tax=Hohenbuehelia grisea TaxID=104357 RepID=A0ABR3JIS7_9AGAR
MIGRQPSVTSLSKYATGKSPNADLFNGNKSRDFCNSFWGAGDAGVNILLARMRGAARTMDELRNFWKQRSIIEEEYANRLTSLAKTAVGKDEIGELRNSIETLLQETENQAGFHLQLAHEIRNEIEVPTAAFSTKQSLHKTTYQVQIEKKFKAKIAQEAYVNKAREKYEGDVLRINSYTTQLAQQKSDPNGAAAKDADRIQQKLTRAQQTVQANEKDYLNFAKGLAELIPRWELEWKDFCDKCQDLEEERIVFMRDNIWAYANAVSTLCIVDDQSCEKMRVALDQLEPEKDMEYFVQEYGTGNSIPDQPKTGSTVVNGTTSPSSSRSRIAKFERKTDRSDAPDYQPSPLVNVTAPAREIPSQKPVPQSQPPPPPVQQPPEPPAPAPTAVQPSRPPAGDPIDRNLLRNGSQGDNLEPDAQSKRSGPSRGPSNETSPIINNAPPTRAMPSVNTHLDAPRHDGLPPSEASPQYDRMPPPSPSRSPGDAGQVLFYGLLALPYSICECVS